jgi:hypothetical protein
MMKKLANTPARIEYFNTILMLLNCGQPAHTQILYFQRQLDCSNSELGILRLEFTQTP